MQWKNHAESSNALCLYRNIFRTVQVNLTDVSYDAADLGLVVSAWEGLPRMIVYQRK